MRSVIIRPVITEQSLKSAKTGVFTFQVATEAHKHLIKEAVEKQYGVNVLQISTSIVKGKKKRFGPKRHEVIHPNWKKAMVRLKEDQKIDLFQTGS